jgi:hypothetical protein
MISPSRPQLRPGTYPARLCQWIDLGTHPSPFQEGKTLRTCRLTFTVFLPPTKHQEPSTRNQEQLLVSKDFTLSLNSRAGLRKFLESWRGQPMSAEDLTDFHPLKALEKPCLLSIALSDPDAQSRRWPRITGILRLPHGMPPPPDLRMPARNFSLAEPSRLVFQTLPQFLQTKIRTSREWSNLKQQAARA